jgi:hypothetical protein
MDILFPQITINQQYRMLELSGNGEGKIYGSKSFPFPRQSAGNHDSVASGFLSSL